MLILRFPRQDTIIRKTSKGLFECLLVAEIEGMMRSDQLGEDFS
jgi:hypothetical protein